MKDEKLNINDKLKLKTDIKISMVLGLLFSFALVVIVLLIPGVLFLFGKKPSDGFASRFLFIAGLLFVPFLLISWTNILKYIDLKIGKKLIIKTDNYELINKKDTAYILIRGDKKKKIEIDNELIPLINISQPLTIEISKFSKLLLFVSNDKDNLLDKLYSDDK